MELHQLKYFVEVVRIGNFTRAAARCHVTQPTLSHQIKKLEAELREPLLQRRKGGAIPTPFGQRFYQRALRILREIEEAEEDAAAFAGEPRGRLRIGAIPTVAPYLLPSLIATAAQHYPDLRFDLSEEPTDVLLNLLRQGALDLALVSPPIEGDEWAFQPLLEDELLLTLPQMHPLGKARRIELADILGLPLVLMKEAHCLRGQTLELCKKAEVEPEISIQSSQLGTVLALVQAGFGLTFTPAMALPHFSGTKLIFRSLAPEKVSRQISFIWPRSAHRTQAFSAFLELAGGIEPMAKG